MRTIDSDLETEQQDTSVAALYKVALVLDAGTTTYEQDRILSIDHTEEQWSQRAEIVLDNSDKTIDTDFKGYKATISYGATTAAGAKYSACAPLWVVGQQRHSSPGILTVTLSCIGIPDLLAQDHANASHTRASTDTDTVKTIVNSVADKTLAPFDHTIAYTATHDSEDSLYDSYNPADLFGFGLNETRLAVFQQLLFYTRVVMRAEDDGALHFFVPTTEGNDWLASTAYAVNDYVRDPTSPANNFAFRCTTAGTTGGSEPTWPTVAGNTVTDGSVVWTAVAFDEEYRVNVSGQHELLAKSHRTRVIMPNYIEVESHPDSVDSYTGKYEWEDSSDITNFEKRLHYQMRVGSNAEATDIATAIMEHEVLGAQTGAALVPMNCFQEVYDFVKLTDSRDDNNIRIGNISTIHRVAGHGKYEMEIALGGSAALGLYVVSEPLSADGTGLSQELVDELNTRLARQDAKINELINALSTAESNLESTVRAFNAFMLSAQMESLHVTERLRIPVGSDKFD